MTIWSMWQQFGFQQVLNQTSCQQSYDPCLTLVHILRPSFQSQWSRFPCSEALKTMPGQHPRTSAAHLRRAEGQADLHEEWLPSPGRHRDRRADQDPSSRYHSRISSRQRQQQQQYHLHIQPRHPLSATFRLLVASPQQHCELASLSGHDKSLRQSSPWQKLA